MATELEVKLAVDDLQLLDCILCSADVSSKMQGGFTYTKMRSTYYDTPEGDFRKNRQTLRLRQENERSVLCFKSPVDEHTRREWETETEYLDEGLPKLTALGAPELLARLDPERLTVLCGAEFTRISASLHFKDGSVCELAGDIGQLLGGGRSQPLCELELELKQGEPDEMLALSEKLCTTFRIREEHKSKFARANALAQA